MSLAPKMARALRSRSRCLEWFFKFDNGAGALYAWTGVENIQWDSKTWRGLGLLGSFKDLDNTSALQHKAREYKLSGIDSDSAELIDANVRDRGFEQWIAAIENGRVVPEPYQVANGTQDQIVTEHNGDGTSTITLKCFEAMPFINKSPNRVITHEGQLTKFPTDAGFALLSEVALRRQAVEWQQG